ncbi:MULTISPECIES: DUF554 domain-containing protein [Aerococcus]|uniref:DUF554 domain-containing protein n=1 Tax=Aerococcus sanguinicola TaxID=119206 RepID=A0A5N1GK09_9LACT|nr:MULTISPECIES: DUF554 domain-containing protein [Aerococcus]KAA9300529.1 DUF554 domain-containing protein [Aerococcus sanguinicola]MDK6370167.1 DUF554 domain-containing protein [Aerococcus sp. UMB9870]MDK6680291.1 DUF554 domain-containing protein [Aerococcus sp. UMB8608]MDK6686871.1 DUF554 domain-containing protein [Aerococcus sp. UMB8623]MDK6939982.1 DUF554 domain-containing protein [Aerococcus sp. UMB8487]
MIGLGTVINCVGILLGGLVGSLAGHLFTAKQQDALQKACAVSVIFIAIAGAMEGMLSIASGDLVSGRSMLVVLCLALGSLIGEVLGIDRGFEKLGRFLHQKTGNGMDPLFVEAFITASLTVSIGAMAIVGAIQDGLLGDYSMLAVKSVLDAIIIAVLTSAMGKGAVFSVIPVLVLEGGVTLLARLLAPIMTDLALAYLSLIGSILIFCIGINLLWEKKLNVANMLPAVVLAVLAAFLPV